MPVKSIAIIRVKVENPDGTEREDRIFKRPDGNFTRSSYDSDKTPDVEPQKGSKETIPAEYAELLIKLITGQDL
jgi:hypothetical protein